ncbi:MAG: protein-glutamate O-methyltransferase CheR [Rhizobacter sp.]|nr:protein-glutamate O-methyltransferase CheR [Bacteriovorax sp.]
MLPAQNNSDEMDNVTLVRVIGVVHKLTGITMAEHKKPLLQSRLKKRMRELQITSYGEYMDYLAKTAGETQNFINVVTTNETTFFRTPKVWSFFEKEFLPEWHKNNPRTMLTLWSAASSSGEEAYSLAILCSEFKLKTPGFDFKILATDISSAVLAEAEAGEYHDRAVEFFKRAKPELYDRYFSKKDESTHIISSEVKKKVQFLPHNLFSVKKEQFDIIFLRNVLIYFSSEDQENVLMNVSRSLKINGHLIIGESESLSRLNTPYHFISACIYDLRKEGK